MIKLRVLSHFFYTGKLISSFSAFSVETVIPVESVAVSGRTVSSRTGNRYIDHFAIVFGLIQFVDSFLSLNVVRHFYETEATGSSCFPVSDNFC